MDSVDTNVLARYYLGDHPAQSAQARALLDDSDGLWVPVTVVLELCWLLDSRYDLTRVAVVRVLRHLLALDAVHVENEEAVVAAIDGYEQGLDFADALHLAASKLCDRFLTFDRKVSNRAQGLGLKPYCEALIGSKL